MSDEQEIEVGATSLSAPGEPALKKSRTIARRRQVVSEMIDQAKKLEAGERKCRGSVKLRDETPERNYLRDANGKVLTRPCKQFAMRGGTVCLKHGGSAPQVKRKAQQRLNAMVEPGLIRLEALIHQDEHKPTSLGAIKEMLERAGGSPTGSVAKDTGERDMRPQISVNIAVGGLDMVKAGIKVNSTMLPMAAAEIIEEDDGE